MPAKIYHDADADLSLLQGKTVAVLGYGSQGHAQLKTSAIAAAAWWSPSCRARRPTRVPKATVSSRFPPPVLRPRATWFALLLPDQRQAEVFQAEIRPNLRPGKVLVAAHGLALDFGRIERPRASRPCWWCRTGRAAWCARSISSAAACLAWWPSPASGRGRRQRTPRPPCSPWLWPTPRRLVHALRGDPEHAGRRNRHRSVRRAGSALRRARAPY